MNTLQQKYKELIELYEEWRDKNIPIKQYKEILILQDKIAELEATPIQSEISGTLLFSELLKRADEVNEDGLPVVKRIESEPNGCDTPYLRYDAVVFELNKLNKECTNQATPIQSAEILTPDEMLKKYDVNIDRWADTKSLIIKAMIAYASQPKQDKPKEIINWEIAEQEAHKLFCLPENVHLTYPTTLLNYIKNNFSFLRNDVAKQDKPKI